MVWLDRLLHTLGMVWRCPSPARAEDARQLVHAWHSTAGTGMREGAIIAAEGYSATPQLYARHTYVLKSGS